MEFSRLLLSIAFYIYIFTKCLWYNLYFVLCIFFIYSLSCITCKLSFYSLSLFLRVAVDNHYRSDIINNNLHTRKDYYDCKFNTFYPKQIFSLYQFKVYWNFLSWFYLLLFLYKYSYLSVFDIISTLFYVIFYCILYYL